MTRVVLAYSGGLDTSVAVRWLMDNYNLEVVTLTADLGGGIDLEAARQKALQVGAVDAHRDGRARGLRAGLRLAVPPGRRALRREISAGDGAGPPADRAAHGRRGAQDRRDAVAHGCTGKGNDQVRFDVATTALGPGPEESIAPGPRVEDDARGGDRVRRRARHRGRGDQGSLYSTDQNLWGRSIEGGILEDPGVEPPEDAYQWTVSTAQRRPTSRAEVEIEFERGRARRRRTASASDGSTLIERAERRGRRARRRPRSTTIENRLVGHQVARDLRGARRRRAARGAPRASRT